MFDKSKTKTELMIVCDDKTIKYANYLMQLIGHNDDAGDVVVGTKDGAVSAAIYSTKEYKDTSAKITSNTHILFIGNNDIVKEQAASINCILNKYGMHFGWLGKRAVMYVDKDVLKKDDYDNFISFSKKYQKEVEKIEVKFIHALPEKAKWAGVFSTLLLPIVYPVVIYGLMSGVVYGSKKHKQIREQQYRCLTIVSYMDHLSNFLEG